MHKEHDMAFLPYHGGPTPCAGECPTPARCGGRPQTEAKLRLSWRGSTGHGQKRCYACPGVAAQEIHRGGAGDIGGALSVGRFLAAGDDQSTHASAIKIALPTLAEATR